MDRELSASGALLSKAPKKLMAPRTGRPAPYLKEDLISGPYGRSECDDSSPLATPSALSRFTESSLHTSAPDIICSPLLSIENSVVNGSGFGMR